MTTPDAITVSITDRLGGFDLDVRFEAPGRGVTALFGPSGSGKTSVLRCIAGLHRPAKAYVRIDGEDWDGPQGRWPAHRRRVGYVFQEASLFAHLSVRENLVFGLRRSRDAGIREDEVVPMLGLAPLMDRAPAALSGGERQRVAIGRALLSQPRLLLMDEPLSALDRTSREEILPFLERLHESLAIPVLYVSHDMAEVERLADRLVLLEAGRVAASGPLDVLQSDPSLPLVASRAAAVTLTGTLIDHDPTYGLARFAVAGGTLVLTSPALPAGATRRLRIAAGDVSLACDRPHRSSIVNVLPAVIVSARETSPGEITAVLALGEDGGGARLLARVTRWSWQQLGLDVAQPVFAQVKGVAMGPARLGAP